MTRRPRWILEVDPPLPGPCRVAAEVVDAVALPRMQSGRDAWPAVEPPFVAYGSMATLRRMQRHAPLAAAVFDDYDALRCSSYYRVVYDLLGRTAFLLPFAALPHADLRRMLGDRVFVRPDGNDKSFSARVIAVDELPAFVALHEHRRDELAVVSEVVALGREYRCFCREGKVFCHSSYPDEPFDPAPPEVVAFAEDVASRMFHRLDQRMVTVDVATGSGRLRLVEVGGVNSWGLYGARVADFIRAMEAEALAR